MISKKEKYVEKFLSYPDVLTLEQFRNMLGGIADSRARKLVKENRVLLLLRFFIFDFVKKKNRNNADIVR